MENTNMNTFENTLRRKKLNTIKNMGKQAKPCKTCENVMKKKENTLSHRETHEKCASGSMLKHTKPYENL